MGCNPYLIRHRLCDDGLYFKGSIVLSIQSQVGYSMNKQDYDKQLSAVNAAGNTAILAVVSQLEALLRTGLKQADVDLRLPAVVKIFDDLDNAKAMDILVENVKKELQYRVEAVECELYELLKQGDITMGQLELCGELLDSAKEIVIKNQGQALGMSSLDGDTQVDPLPDGVSSLGDQSPEDPGEVDTVSLPDDIQ